MIFKMYNCEFGLTTVDGTSYDFPHVDSVTIDDPTRTTLVRGSNAKNLEGIVVTEGSKDPKTMTVVMLGVTAELFGVLQTIFETKARCDGTVVDRSDGSSRIAKNSIIAQKPRQLTISEDAESCNVSIEFKTFNLQEVHKS